MIRNLIKIMITLLAFHSSLMLSANENEAAAEATDAIRVTTQALSELTFATEYSAPASVVSLNDSSISAEIQGRAMNIEAEVGNIVKRGQLLVSLDCRTYVNTKKQAEAALKLSKTQLNFSQKQYNRNQRLLKRGVVSRETFDLSESNLLTSRADISIKEVAVESADLAISKCKIYAPFSGQVTNKMVQQGQLVNPGSPLLQLLQTDKLEIEADLSPDELIKAKESRRLLFVTDTGEFTVTIRTVLQQLNSASNTQKVRLTGESMDSENSEDSVLSIAGLNGRLMWKDGTRKLPPEYLVRRKEQLGVMIAEANTAQFRALSGAREGQPVKVNLPRSTQIIIVNRYSVEEGQAVVTE